MPLDYILVKDKTIIDTFTPTASALMPSIEALIHWDKELDKGAVAYVRVGQQESRQMRVKAQELYNKRFHRKAKDKKAF